MIDIESLVSRIIGLVKRDTGRTLTETAEHMLADLLTSVIPAAPASPKTDSTPAHQFPRAFVARVIYDGQATDGVLWRNGSLSVWSMYCGRPVLVNYPSMESLLKTYRIIAWADVRGGEE